MHGLPLIIWIIKDKNKNGWHIKQKTCYRDPTLNLEEILQKSPENKKYGTHIQRMLYF